MRFFVAILDDLLSVFEDSVSLKTAHKFRRLLQAVIHADVIYLLLMHTGVVVIFPVSHLKKSVVLQCLYRLLLFELAKQEICQICIFF